MENNTSHRVTAELRAELARRQITTTDLAHSLDVTPMWLSRRLRDVVPLTVEDLVRIAAALDLDPSRLLAGHGCTATA